MQLAGAGQAELSPVVLDSGVLAPGVEHALVPADVHERSRDGAEQLAEDLPEEADGLRQRDMICVKVPQSPDTSYVPPGTEPR